MPLLVVGTMALDNIETPDQSRESMLGGSAVYFSYAASYFAPVHLVGVVGEDWPSEHTELLRRQGSTRSGLQIVPGTKTFRWHARYSPGLSERKTLDVQLNVYGSHTPYCPSRCDVARSCFWPTVHPSCNGHPGVR